MRVRIKQTPCEDELDGVRLDLLQPGMVKEVSASVGSWLIAERYAEPEMRRSTEDDAFSPMGDLGGVFSAVGGVRDSANDCPRRRATDLDRRS